MSSTSFEDLKDAAVEAGVVEATAEPEALPEPKIDAHGRSYATGRRKESVARVWLKPGAFSL